MLLVSVLKVVNFSLYSLWLQFIEFYLEVMIVLKVRNLNLE